jgi:hypothetical protein
MYRRIRNILFLSFLLPVLSANNLKSLSRWFKSISEKDLIFLTSNNFFDISKNTVDIYEGNQTVGEFCSRDLDLLKKAIFKQELWAIKSK